VRTFLREKIACAKSKRVETAALGGPLAQSKKLMENRMVLIAPINWNSRSPYGVETLSFHFAPP
jgi:hypothetical protein